MKARNSFIKVLNILIVITIALPSFAQDMDAAKKSYNEAIEAKKAEDFPLAAEKLTAALEISQEVWDMEEDEEAYDLSEQIKNILPGMYLLAGQSKIKSGSIKEGLDMLYTSKEKAADFGDSESESKASNFIARVHYKLGISKYKKKELEAALSELDKAIAADSSFAKSYYIKVAIYKNMGNDESLKKDAAKGIAAAKASNDNSTKAKIEKLAGSYFLKKGNEAKESSKYSEAIEELKTSLEFNETNSTAYYLLAAVYNLNKKRLVFQSLFKYNL